MLNAELEAGSPLRLDAIRPHDREERHQCDDDEVPDS